MRPLRAALALALPVASVGVVLALPAAGAGHKPATVRPAATITQNPANGTPTTVDVFALNDLHGYVNGSDNPGNADGVAAGGTPQLAAVLDAARATKANNITVAAGDNVGASPLDSGIFDDEPTLDILDRLGVAYSAPGNHEFDNGIDELKRKQNGGCTWPAGTVTPSSVQAQACTFSNPLTGSTTYAGLSSMQYLAANVVTAGSDTASNPYGTPIFQPTAVKSFPKAGGGTIKVGFIGEVLKGTPSIVTPTGVAGLDFLDEATTANHYADDLVQNQGVNAVVLLIHQGGFQSSPFSVNTCNGFSGDITPIMQNLDANIPVVVSAHTHAEYNCAVTTPSGTKLLTQALSYGRVLSDITLTFNGDGTLNTASDNNTIVPRSQAAPTGDPVYNDVNALATAAKTQAAVKGDVVVGAITADLNRNANAAGESSLGDVIADSQLDYSNQQFAAASSSRHVQVAFMNPGGIRNDLVYATVNHAAGDGKVTYADAFNVQPFGNALTVKDMTGADIYQVLEQQFNGCFGQASGSKTLQVSRGFTYQIPPNASDPGVPCTSKIVPGSVAIDGTPIVATTTYTVEMNSFLATGGDGFGAFNNGTNQTGVGQDIDAFAAYLTAHNPQAPTARDRITVSSVAAALPESPLPILLPIIAVLMVAGGGAIAFRKRGARTAV